MTDDELFQFMRGFGNASWEGLNRYKILFKKLHPNAIIPSPQKIGDAGYDLSSDGTYRVERGSRVLVNTGVAVAIPKGYVGLLCSRSGLALNKGIQVLNAPGIIDENYRGELKVLLHNTGESCWVDSGDRIAQLVVVPYHTLGSCEVDELPENSVRGERGFGSSDNKEQK